MATCDSIIINDDDKVPTLIGVFCALKAGGVDIPANAVAPRDWAIFTMWLANSGDMNKEFTQQCKVVDPSGNQYGQNTNNFTMTQLSHSLKLKVPGFPVGAQGVMEITVWLESKGKKIPETQHIHKVQIEHVKVSKQ